MVERITYKNVVKRRTLRAGFLTLSAILGIGMLQLAAAQNQPVTFVVPFAAGTATDGLARSIANAITAREGITVVVDNKPGASGIIAASYVAKSKPDGKTVLIGSNTTHAANPFLFKELQYDPLNDFVPITTTGRGAQILVVPNSSRFGSLDDLIRALATDELTFGSGSASSRVAGELFQQMTNGKMVNVPYKGNTHALTDLMAGRLDLMFTDSATGIPLVTNGQVKALGVTSTKAIEGLPNIAPISKTLPGYELTYWSGAWAPAGTSPERVQELHKLITGAIHDSRTDPYYVNSATDKFTQTPQEFAKFVSYELKRWGEVIKAAGVQPE